MSPANQLLTNSRVSISRVPKRGPRGPHLSRTTTTGVRRDVAALFSQLRPEIKQLIDKYLDRRIRRRIDASDIVQSAYIDVQERLARYLEERPMEVRNWLFFLAKMKTLEVNQHHLASQKRAVAREENDCELRELPKDSTSPSLVVSRKETKERLHAAIGLLPVRYRQVIELRHLQHLSNSQVSEELGISQKAASKLYVRALNSLQQVLSA